ncbi:hypothetical protein AZI87_12425 [Bdellovibrio bacteriovorus]|uniref:Uncharacterized protein n=1 Tax=Bdellovibrio bacteriovorus TaxID=959 RepID=A0A162G9E8_BDEBC|nr:hypothetical protein [Bdellovibrio bacteriovorus]KYG65351.1 hypothetical protein AZI87_12425 [Bdellovibrio bacteriovorus]
MEGKLFCFNCNKEMAFAGVIGRREECPHCRADVHVCKNCEHYDPKVYNECREPQADVVREKDRANFCDYFTPRKGSGGGIDKAAALRAAAEALFKKS